ncbi:hypothetical protein KC686_01625 [Candidatus Woesebacteria bacterium]|nr:hypothetical protein [Candidatus Woesebacteria bacterium]
MLIPFMVCAMPIQADNLESSSYKIQFGNFNITSGEKSSSNYKVTDTVGQTAAGPFGQYGSDSYFVGSGFQYIYPLQEFTFTISKTAIDFGTLTAGTHNTDSHTLTVSTKGAGGYTVYARELHPLEHTTTPSQTIPNTTCDAGACTISEAKVWNNQNIGGFGYNMSGQDIPADFSTLSHFRPFANQAVAEPAQVVMSGTGVVSDRQSTVTYKAGMFGSETAGEYETGIIYTAVPGY